MGGFRFAGFMRSNTSIAALYRFEVHPSRACCNVRRGPCEGMQTKPDSHFTHDEADNV